MTEHRIVRLIGLATGHSTVSDGRYLVRYDPLPRPHGTVVTSADITRAMVFKDFQDAFEYVQQQHGVRPDGLPNKPLTAYHLEIFAPSARI